MTTRTKRVSASSIKTIKACPIRYRNAYVYGIRREEQTDIQRIGTNWHECLEVMAKDGKGAVVTLLNERYKNCPANKDRLAWMKERAVLLYSAFTYDWYYSEADGYEVLATEVGFELPMYDPRTGEEIADAVLIGYIDKLVRNSNGIVMVQEQKSTSSSVDSGSDYWAGLNLDTQSMLYIVAARRMQRLGMLEQYGIKADDPLISGCLYDAWHKPATKPVKLTQADTKKFLAPEGGGVYYGVEYEIVNAEALQKGDTNRLFVDGEEVEVFKSNPDKKGNVKYAIRESTDMYGARLQADMIEQPTKYFGRLEIPHTDQQLAAFEIELFNLYREMKLRPALDMWYKDESQCEATFKCDYRESCYNGLDILENIPAGFKKPYWERETK